MRVTHRLAADGFILTRSVDDNIAVLSREQAIRLADDLSELLVTGSHLAECAWDDDAKQYRCADGCEIKRINESGSASLEPPRAPLDLQKAVTDLIMERKKLLTEIESLRAEVERWRSQAETKI